MCKIICKKNLSLSLSLTLSIVLLSSVSTILYGVSFGNPFGVMNPERNMTKSELIKAVRLMVSAEYEAVQNYMQVAESTDDALVKKVFTDIANEERVHAGEFLRVLHYLEPEEDKFYKDGIKEVEENIKQLEAKPESEVKPESVAKPVSKVVSEDETKIKAKLETKPVISEQKAETKLEKPATKPGAPKQK